MKLNSFNVTLSNVFIRLFFIRFLISNYKTIMFILNQMEFKSNGPQSHAYRAHLLSTEISGGTMRCA